MLQPQLPPSLILSHSSFWLLPVHEHLSTYYIWQFPCENCSGQMNFQICCEFASKCFFPSLGKYVFVMVTAMLCSSPNGGKKRHLSICRQFSFHRFPQVRIFYTKLLYFYFICCRKLKKFCVCANPNSRQSAAFF